MSKWWEQDDLHGNYIFGLSGVSLGGIRPYTEV